MHERNSGSTKKHKGRVHALYSINILCRCITLIQGHLRWGRGDQSFSLRLSHTHIEHKSVKSPRWLQALGCRDSDILLTAPGWYICHHRCKLMPHTASAPVHTAWNKTLEFMMSILHRWLHNSPLMPEPPKWRRRQPKDAVCPLTPHMRRPSNCNKDGRGSMSHMLSHLSLLISRQIIRRNVMNWRGNLILKLSTRPCASFKMGVFAIVKLSHSK